MASGVTTCSGVISASAATIDASWNCPGLFSLNQSFPWSVGMVSSTDQKRILGSLTGPVCSMLNVARTCDTQDST